VNLNGFGVGIGAEAEVDGDIAGGCVADAGGPVVELLAGGGDELDAGADAIAIAPGAVEGEVEPVIVVGGVVDPDFGDGSEGTELGVVGVGKAGFGVDVGEGAVAVVAEETAAVPGGVFVEGGDVGAVGEEDVGVAVAVVVEVEDGAAAGHAFGEIVGGGWVVLEAEGNFVEFEGDGEGDGSRGVVWRRASAVIAKRSVAAMRRGRGETDCMAVAGSRYRILRGWRGLRAVVVDGGILRGR
jgi:hypothetical protein